MARDLRDAAQFRALNITWEAGFGACVFGDDGVLFLGGFLQSKDTLVESKARRCIGDINPGILVWQS